jgi:xanthine/uracil/vitamin C permease (AzgA family)
MRIDWDKYIMAMGEFFTAALIGGTITLTVIALGVLIYAVLHFLFYDWLNGK